MTREEYKDMYDVVGAAMEVYNTLGRGMAEAIYQESLDKEFRRRGILWMNYIMAITINYGH